MLNRLKSLLSPALFWRFYADEFYQDQWQHRIFPQHRWLLKIVQKLKPNHILEVGCGFGRNLNFLLEQGIAPQKLTGVDFSSKLLQLAKVKLPISVALHLDKVQHLPFPNRQFDLTFTHGLLMHLPPPQIHLALSELIRVTRRWLIIIEETRKKPGRINHFTWAHDYSKLISQLNLKIIDECHDRYHLVWYLLEP